MPMGSKTATHPVLWSPLCGIKARLADKLATVLRAEPTNCGPTCVCCLQEQQQKSRCLHDPGGRPGASWMQVC
jgi:hypothetical protein